MVVFDSALRQRWTLIESGKLGHDWLDKLKQGAYDKEYKITRWNKQVNGYLKNNTRMPINLRLESFYIFNLAPRGEWPEQK